MGLMLMLTMVDTTVLATEPTDMDILMDTEATDTDTTWARGPLMPSPPLMLMPMLTTDTTVLDTEATDTDIPLDTAVTTDTTLARGPLMPSPPLMLTLMLTTDTTVLDTELPTDTDIPTDTAVTTDTTLARGLLMLSPPLMLMLTMVDTTDMPPMPTDMPAELMPILPTPLVDTEPTWGNLPKPNQRLISNNEIKSSREGVKKN